MCRHTQGSVGLWIMPRSCLQGRRRWCSKHVSIHESESHVACDDIGTHHEPHVTSGAGGMRWAGCLFMVWCANTLLAGIYWCVVAGGYGACVQGSSPTQVQVCDLHLICLLWHALGGGWVLHPNWIIHHGMWLPWTGTYFATCVVLRHLRCVGAPPRPSPCTRDCA